MPEIIYVRAEQVIYKKWDSSIRRYTMLSSTDATGQIINDKIYNEYVKIKYPDAALNRLSKATGFDYLKYGVVAFKLFRRSNKSIMFHCFKKYGNNCVEIHECNEANVQTNAEPMDPRITIEYLAGIGVKKIDGFHDIIVSTVVSDD